MNILCALMWEVASIRIFSIGRGSPYIGKTFQVLDIRRKGEENRFVAL